MEHPDADRLLVLTVDLGEEQRQLVAGLAQEYELEELEGKHVVVVTNLKPAVLRGEKSEGMVLAAHGEEQIGLLLAPDAEPGTRVCLSDEATVTPPDQITIDDFSEHEIIASPRGVTLDGELLDCVSLEVDREAYGRVS
ncbi:MAG: hypothetical protein R6W82_00855 [bacterium]